MKTFTEKADDAKDFSTRMIEKYPDLFPKDAEGNPRQPDCGLWCPPGWQHIVESLCSSIDYRVKNPSNQQTWKTLYRVQTFAFQKLFVPVYNRIYRWIDPCECLHWKDGKRQNWIIIRNDENKKLEAKHPVRAYLKKKISRVSAFLRPAYRWKKVACPPVTIDQVKEKFGTLRFYYSGGDAHVASIVSFAEVLTGSVCEESGAPGILQKRGGWYKVLSKEVGDLLGYSAA
jgi:hypothetical protein